MADRTDTTEKHAVLVCLMSGAGILLSCGGMLIWPSWVLTYAMTFFASLYMVGMVVHSVCWLQNVRSDG